MNRISSSKILVIEARVEIIEKMNRRIVRRRQFNAIGKDGSGNTRKALNNCRLNAEYKYRYEYTISTGVRLYSIVKSYKVVSRERSDKVYAKRYARKGKYYFHIRDKETNRLVGGGRWRTYSTEIDDLVEETNQQQNI